MADRRTWATTAAAQTFQWGQNGSDPFAAVGRLGFVTCIKPLDWIALCDQDHLTETDEPGPGTPDGAVPVSIATFYPGER
jgi:hypothetical protein